MGKFVYPDSWKKLSLVPGARSDLIGFVREVAEWNDKNSHIKKHGADDLIGFFYDTYGANEGARYLVGQIIFADEAECFDRFFREFDQFLREWERSEQNLNRFHEATLTERVTEEAEKLLHKLEERGIAEWRE